MNTQSPANDAPRASVGHRLLGVLIMTKAPLPLTLLALLAFGVWQMASGVSRRWTTRAARSSRGWRWSRHEAVRQINESAQ